MMSEDSTILVGRTLTWACCGMNGPAGLSGGTKCKCGSLEVTFA